MSWLTDLTSKAEELLNKVDQTTASAVSTPPPGTKTITSRPPSQSPVTWGHQRTPSNRSIASDGQSLTHTSSRSSTPSVAPEDLRQSPAAELPPPPLPPAVDEPMRKVQSSSALSLQAPPPRANDDVDANVLVTENTMLKSEVSTLTDQLDWLRRREKREKVAEVDLKDELENTKARLAAAEASSAQLQNELSHLSQLNERLLAEHATQQSEQQLRSDRTAEVEAVRQELANLHSDHEHELASVRRAHDEDKQRFASQLTEVSRQLATTQSVSSQFERTSAVANEGRAAAENELRDYKEKAARTLAAKDRLISSLRSGVAPQADSAQHSATGPDGEQAELERLARERDALQAELTLAIQSRQGEVATLERQLIEIEANSAASLASLEEHVAQQRAEKNELELEIQRLSSRLNSVETTSAAAREKFSARIESREKELELRERELSIARTRPAELEARVSTLTETLLEKQSVAERLASEKTSLAIQLERALQQKQQTNVNVGIPEASRRPPDFMRVNSGDPPMVRHVKSALTVVDSFCLRGGIFLRRNPTARLLLLVYTFVLHFWGFVVLMTYQPEMHHTGYKPPVPEPS